MKNKQHKQTGADLIAKERRRQLREEKWTLFHDASHTEFQLTKAAVSYAQTVASPDEYAKLRGNPPEPTDEWPWEKKWWKPSEEPIRNLVKAGALIAAEIDRLLGFCGERTCRRCGCTQFTPCLTFEGACAWASINLCTACETPKERVRRRLNRIQNKKSRSKR